MKTSSIPRIPPWLKIPCTAFLAIMIPIHWISYGPTNFLYFCDVALLLVLVGVWRGNALLVSLPAVGVLLPQALWCIDFVIQLFGRNMTGMTAYMFDQRSPLFLRSLPPPAGAIIGVPKIPRNVNYVFGMDDGSPQSLLPTPAYRVTWITVLIGDVLFPTHLLLKRLAPVAR